MVPSVFASERVATASSTIMMGVPTRDLFLGSIIFLIAFAIAYLYFQKRK